MNRKTNRSEFLDAALADMQEDPPIFAHHPDKHHPIIAILMSLGLCCASWGILLLLGCFRGHAVPIALSLTGAVYLAVELTRG